MQALAETKPDEALKVPGVETDETRSTRSRSIRTRAILRSKKASLAGRIWKCRSHNLAEDVSRGSTRIIGMFCFRASFHTGTVCTEVTGGFFPPKNNEPTVQRIGGLMHI